MNKNLIIIGLLIVKNEEDIIEDTIMWYKSQNIDGLIICDTGSTDKTIEIITSFKDGFILEFIQKDRFLQSEISLEMANFASEKYNVDWVLPLDADEFYYPKNEFLSLKDTISLLDEGGYFNLYVPRKKYYPTELDKETDNLIQRFNYFTYQTNWKAVGKYNNPMVFEPGNHQIYNSHDRYPLTIDNQLLEVRHYEIRSYKQLLTKLKRINDVWKYIWDYDTNQRGHWNYLLKHKDRNIEEVALELWNSIYKTEKQVRELVKEQKLQFDISL